MSSSLCIFTVSLSIYKPNTSKQIKMEHLLYTYCMRGIVLSALHVNLGLSWQQVYEVSMTLILIAEETGVQKSWGTCPKLHNLGGYPLFFLTEIVSLVYKRHVVLISLPIFLLYMKEASGWSFIPWKPTAALSSSPILTFLFMDPRSGSTWTESYDQL